MQTANIEYKYLANDDVLNAINKYFISLNINEEKKNNQYLKTIFKELIEAMKRQSPLFNETFQRIVWAGSYYKKTRVAEPKEYDINFVINLPIREKDIQFISDCPGFIKICIRNRDIKSNISRELKNFIDNEMYLNQKNFRSWIEGILDKVASKSSKSNRIILNRISITKKKAGPAFTLSFPIEEKFIDIDIVPVLAFSGSNLPPNCLKKSILQKYNSRCWFAVPKPLNKSKTMFKDDQELNHYWRLCFYEIEKDILNEHGRAKPIIRYLKKFKETQQWNIASYYIETLCLNELDTFQNSNQSDTFLFFTMLLKLREAFCKGSIIFFWDKNLNLLENIEPSTITNMKGKIDRIIKLIERNIARDKFAIAKFILNENDVKKLIFLINQSGSSKSEEFESANQWNCMIV